MNSRAPGGGSTAGLAWAVFFLAILLTAGAMPVFAFAEDEPGPSSSALQAPAPTAQEVAEAERKEREHREWLASPEAARRRELSRAAYGHLAIGQARDLLLEAFPAQFKALNADPARHLDELNIEKVLGERIRNQAQRGTT